MRKGIRKTMKKGGKKNMGEEKENHEFLLLQSAWEGEKGDKNEKEEEEEDERRRKFMNKKKTIRSK